MNYYKQNKDLVKRFQNGASIGSKMFGTNANAGDLYKPLTGLPAINPSDFTGLDVQELEALAAQEAATESADGAEDKTAPANDDLTPSNEELIKELDTKLANAKTPEQIAELQKTLGVEPDSKWGPLSKRAFNSAKRKLFLETPAGKAEDEKIRKYQRRLGVKVDGIVGPETRGAIDRIKAIQANLNVKQDGLFGKDTSRALRAGLTEGTGAGFDIGFSTLNGPLQVTRQEPVDLSRSDRREVRRDARQERREAIREARSLPRMKRGGLFYNTVEK